MLGLRHWEKSTCKKLRNREIDQRAREESPKVIRGSNIKASGLKRFQTRKTKAKKRERSQIKTWGQPLPGAGKMREGFLFTSL